MKAIIQRLEVAEEQLRRLHQTTPAQNGGLEVQGGREYRLDVALQALQGALSLLKQLPDIRSWDNKPHEHEHSGFPVRVVWKRPRKRQQFEGRLLKDGRIRLADGRGPFTPTGACTALVPGGSVNGWREWKYWDVDTQKWLKIDELRIAGNFE